MPKSTVITEGFNITRSKTIKLNDARIKNPFLKGLKVALKSSDYVTQEDDSIETTDNGFKAICKGVTIYGESSLFIAFGRNRTGALKLPINDINSSARTILFDYIIPSMKYGIPIVMMEPTLVLEKLGMTQATYYKGMQSLTVANIIAKNDEFPYEYWINPEYIRFGSVLKYLMHDLGNYYEEVLLKAIRDAS